MGGTLANMRGYIESEGGKVLAAASLTGKPHSAKLALSSERGFSLLLRKTSDFLIRQENGLAQIPAYSGGVGASAGANRGLHRSYKCHWNS
jgi:hypothetical protein